MKPHILYNLQLGISHSTDSNGRDVGGFTVSFVCEDTGENFYESYKTWEEMQDGINNYINNFEPIEK